MGFAYFWGFLGGENSHYDPLLGENQTIVGVPDDKDFYLTTAMADRAIEWIRNQQSQSPDKPTLLPVFRDGCESLAASCAKGVG
jgi:arylsulfatase